MTVIEVTASQNYKVEIGRGLLDLAGEKLKKIAKTKKIAIVTETNVAPLYEKRLRKSLTAAGFSVCTFVFRAGEASKNGATYLELLGFLASNQVTRTDMVVALGGGVTGDLAGFAASTYLRGVNFIQIPTTLLAAVDSSVGGKNAINLPAENLAGSFYQPNLVLCDYELMNTLPEQVFREGCAEVIKYGILFDPQMFRHLWDERLDFQREYVIARCVEAKARVVAEDEYDRGNRQMLNLGHTVGHGIEKVSGLSISHGAAVAAGLAIVSRSSAAMGVCSGACADKIVGLLDKFGLPTRTKLPVDVLVHTMLSDKKRSGNYVNLILPEDIGACRIQKMPIARLQSFVEAGL